MGQLSGTLTRTWVLQPPRWQAYRNDVLTTIWVVNPPGERFVFKQISTPHAYSTWRTELNGKPSERRPVLHC